jgi:hypothetical protein
MNNYLQNNNIQENLHSYLKSWEKRKDFSHKNLRTYFQITFELYIFYRSY